MLTPSALRRWVITAPQAENRLNDQAAIIPPPLLRVNLRGPMQAQDADGRSVLPKSRKTRAILALLAAAAPQPILRTQLIALLWSKREPQQARGSLRQSLHELQQSLEPHASSLLDIDRFKASLRTEGLSVHFSTPDAPANDWADHSAKPMDDLLGLDPALDAFLSSKQSVLQSRSEAESASPNLPANDALLHVSEAQARISGPINTPAVVHPRQIDRLRVGVVQIRTIGESNGSGMAEGLTEELVHALARFHSLSCVPLGTLPTFLDDSARQALWDKLKVDCLLDGTVQEGNDRVRINLRLLDLQSGGEVAWVDRFDLEVGNPLEFQEEIAARTVIQLETKLMLWGAQRAVHLSSSNTNLRELLSSALLRIFRLDRTMFETAGQSLQEALRLVPNNSTILSWLAQWHMFSIGQGWAKNVADATRQAKDLAGLATDLSPDDAQALTLLGHVQGFVERRPELALDILSRAVKANPNLPMAWCRSAFANSYAGQHQTAVEQASHARQMSPLHPLSFLFESALAVPLLFRGEYKASVAAGERAIALNPGFSSSFKTQLSALGHLGLRDRAAEIRQQLLRLEPGFSVSQAMDRSPIQLSEDRDRYAEGLRLGGLS